MAKATKNEKTGLVPVKLLSNYRTNNAGEVAGFEEKTAAELVSKGHAEYVDAPEKK